MPEQQSQARKSSTRRRRRVVAFVMVESPEMRIFNAAALNEPDRPRRVRLGTYWCAADKPEHVEVAAVYDGTQVPDDAECCECGIGIRELQVLVG